MEVNYVAPFLLTSELLPLLQKGASVSLGERPSGGSAPSDEEPDRWGGGGGAVIINVSSRLAFSQGEEQVRTEERGKSQES